MNREDWLYRVNENIRYRIELLQRCESDRTLQLLCLERAKRDLVWFCNTFVVTYNPRETPSVLPFYLFPKQEECLRWFEALQKEKKTGILEKSRYTGATWLAGLLLVHHWLFFNNFNGGLGSRKADLVDKKGDPDCIFEKIREIIHRLPKWMIADSDWKDKTMLLTNLKTGSTIRGEGGDNIGRGGRSTIYVVDESGFVERSEKMIASLSENTDTVIHISTANGTGNSFYRMRSSGYFPVFRLHYSDDPRRTPEQIEQKREELPPHIFASEMEIDYTASVEGIYIKSIWVRAAVAAHLRIEGLSEVARGKYAGLDVATEGSNKNVLVIRTGVVVDGLEEWSGLDTTQTTFKCDRLLRERGIKSICFDGDGVGAGVAGTFGSMYNLPYSVSVFHGGSSPSEAYWDGEGRTAKEKFRNRRVEAWGIVRERFRKTYEVIEGIRSHPLEELISIPNNGELIHQLSQPVIKYDSSGKELLESKDDMRKRGISSPDMADALVYAFGDNVSFDWMSA